MKSTSKKESRLAAAATPIPDKLYFRIGDVAKLCGVEAYVLRFWETEFPQLKPNKSGTGQRLYRKRDVELALRIKRLLHQDGYTIQGARQVFAAETREAKAHPQDELPLKRGAATHGSTEKQLQKMRAELRDILGILNAPVKSDRRDKSPKQERQQQPSRPGLFDN
ncbi:MAG TPA: MerR family transcriptional regulator [Acidobacteriaceae bacterium]|nr:MerR family transcriptional regulator [Acidobacteriaceae bacterium]